MRIKPGPVEWFDSIPSHIIKSPSERYLVGREVKGSSFYLLSKNLKPEAVYPLSVATFLNLSRQRKVS